MHRRTSRSQLVRSLLAEMYAQYILDTGASVREAAKFFNICHSTLHKMIHRELPRMNPSLYNLYITEMNKRSFPEDE